MGGGGGGSQKQSSYKKAHQTPQYDTLLNKADSMLYGGGFFDSQYGGGMDTRASMTPQQQALMENMGSLGQQGLGALESSLGPYDPNNAALTGAIDMAAGDVTRNLQENLLPSIGSGAGQAGQFGSSRHGIAQGLAMRGATEEVGDIATRMRLQDMQAHQANQQSAMQNLGAITSGIEFAGSGGQREEQARLDDLFSKWEYESGADLQNLQAYKGLISGDMGGTEYSKAKSKGGK